MNRSGIAVVGGGPAGARLAERLAAAGRHVTLFDEKLAWEKPCGGGLTDKALARYAFLREAGGGQNWVRECELVSPAGRRVLLTLDRPIAIYSRRALNGLLLERARRAGAAVVQDRVVRLIPCGGGWRLECRGGASVEAEAVAIAAGARGRLGVGTPLAEADAMATAGYYIPLERLPWPAQRMAIRFVTGLEGYIWSFPRADHASVGICGKLGGLSTAALRRRLEAELDRLGAEWRDCAFYAHLLPAPGVARLARAQWAGSSPAPWAAVGDAAGLADPITGEGLYYALRSADLLAEAWNTAPAAYDEAYAAALQQELVPELAAAARIARRFYRGRFLGGSVLERMTQFTARSPRFQRLMCDLFSGAQGYLGLRARLWRNLVPSLLELARPA